jgi:cation diffusion facilitator family transporter
MTNLLLKIFVKDYHSKSDAVRQKCGVLSSIVGIVLNVLLAAAKVAVGVVFGLLSVTADGINNLGDIGNNVVSLVGIKLSAKPADKEHPYGHQRAEYVAALVVALVIITLAIQIVIEAVGKIGQAASFDTNWALIVVLAVAILTKVWMCVFNRKLAKKIDSDLLKAVSFDSLADATSTTTIVISVLIGRFFGINLDGYISILVALFIAYGGVKLFRDTANKLLGTAPSKEALAEIEARIKRFDGVIGFHDLLVHSYGQNKTYASVHVELDSSLTSTEAHDIVDSIEKDFKLNSNVTLLIHTDPVVVDDATDRLYKQVVEVVKSINGEFSVHGFQPRANSHLLSFDVAVPYGVDVDTVAVRGKILEKLKGIDDTLIAEVTVEYQEG